MASRATAVRPMTSSSLRVSSLRPWPLVVTTAKAMPAQASAPSDMTRTPAVRVRPNARARRTTPPPANRRPPAASRRRSPLQSRFTNRSQHTLTPTSLTTLPPTTTTQCPRATPRRCIPRLHTPLLLRLLLPQHRPTTARLHLDPLLLAPRPPTPLTLSVRLHLRGRHPPCTLRTIRRRRPLRTDMLRILLFRGLTTTPTRRRHPLCRRAVQLSRKYLRAM